MKIHLLCDQKWRDLPNLCALKLALENMGHKVLASTTRDARALISAWAPDCVVLNNLVTPENQTLTDLLRQSRIKVAILPTEGMAGSARPELGGLVEGEYSRTWNPDLFLTWSDAAAESLRLRHDWSAARARATGCARFDFYTPGFAAAIKPKTAFCKEHGIDPGRPIVTWATTYAFAELISDPQYYDSFERQGTASGVVACYAKLGMDIRRFGEAMAFGRDLATQSVMALARQRPDWQIIIRPHPAEKRKFYQDHIRKNGLQNVHFAPADYIWNILNATDLHLHRHCTTAVEAWCWGKPTIEMAMDNVPEFAWPEREAGSDAVFDLEQLLAVADSRIAKAPIEPPLAAYRRDYIAKWFGPLDGKNCLRAAQAIDDIARDARPESRSVIAKNLSVGMLAIASSLFNFALNRPPNASLVALESDQRLDPLDRWARRSDVKQYSAMLQDANVLGAAAGDRESPARFVRP